MDKYKIWDVENNTWFRPQYPDRKGNNHITVEIMFSQAGEMYKHKKGVDCIEIDHVTKEQYRPYRYTTSKAESGDKVYEGDIVKVEHYQGETDRGEVKWYDGTGWLIKLDGEENPVSFDFGILEVIEHVEDRRLKTEKEKSEAV